jgi:hypothetical protein
MHAHLCRHASLSAAAPVLRQVVETVPKAFASLTEELQGLVKACNRVLVSHLCFIRLMIMTS